MSSNPFTGQQGMNDWILAVVVSAVAAFAISGAWYAAWGRALGRLHPAYAEGAGRGPAATAAVELARNLVMAVVAAWLVSGLGVASVGEALVLGLVLWAGFPAAILAGSVFHERVPPQLAAIHAGDWLLKLLAVTVLLNAIA
jgi:hypothetical protein